MRDALFHIDRGGDSGLQAQIRQLLMAAIGAGQLAPNEPVPSTRAMARRLGVSRNTVTLAYQALVSEGFLAARERSGFYVDAAALEGMTPLPRAGTPGRGGIDWQARIVRDFTATRLIHRPGDWRRQPYPFIYGQVDAEIFPISEWRDCVRQAMGTRWMEAWTEDQYGRDDPVLIEEIMRRILPRRGITAGTDSILVTMGAQNALYLIAALLIGPETVWAMEDPGYPDLRAIAHLRSPRMLALPVDGQGLAVDDRLAGADILFCTPSHHYPTTVTMPLERRRLLLAAAEAHDIVVVEDDYEFEANYLGTPLPALKSLDTGGRVIHIGSFSKSLMPGLRLGFIVADPALIEALRRLRRLMLRHPPGNNQRATALFMANGHYDVLWRRIHRVYRGRWEAMRRALAADLPGWAEAPGFGGSSWWLTAPEGMDAARLAEAALARGVVIEPGHPFFARSEAGAGHFRLGFSSISEEAIPEGIRRLAEAARGLG